MPRSKNPNDVALEELRRFGLAFPGAHTKRPWPGHLDLAVKDKTFAYMSLAGEPFSISCKLPYSSDEALTLPFTTPTAYGLGKSGWVSAQFPDGTGVPVDLLKQWLEESYRAQAPARLSAGLPPWEGGVQEGPAVQSRSDKKRPRRVGASIPTQKPQASATKTGQKKAPAVAKKKAAKIAPAPAKGTGKRKARGSAGTTVTRTPSAKTSSGKSLSTKSLAAKTSSGKSSRARSSSARAGSAKKRSAKPTASR
jgi:predicted DNA-binding protein (MmcQ/YjbR family)